MVRNTSRSKSTFRIGHSGSEEPVSLPMTPLTSPDGFSGASAEHASSDDSYVTPPSGVPNPRVIGERVAYYRIQRGYSQVDLGKEVGVSSGHISLIESGRRSPSVSVLAGIALALGVTADALAIPVHQAVAGREVRPRKLFGATDLYGMDTFIEYAHWVDDPRSGLEVKVHVSIDASRKSDPIPSKKFNSAWPDNIVLPKGDGVDFILSYRDAGVSGFEDLSGHLVAAYYTIIPPAGMSLIALRRRE